LPFVIEASWASSRTQTGLDGGGGAFAGCAAGD
jgi:hypothetical protein